MAFGAWSQPLTAQIADLDPKYFSKFDADSLAGFDETAARAATINEGFLGAEFRVHMYQLKRRYINDKYNLIDYSAFRTMEQFLNENRPAPVPGCVNEDFEASTAAIITSSSQIAGWVVTSGYNGGISANSTSTMAPYYPGGLSGATSCNLLGCCPMPPQNSELIDCSAPGGFIDNQIGSQYPIYSVFGSGTANSAAAAANPQVTQPMYGNKIIRVNDGLTGDYSIEKLSKTFAVTSQNALFQFAFISVFSPGHGCCDAGGFLIRLSNATTNSVLPCPQFSVSAPSSQCTATVPVDYYVALTGAVYTNTTSANNIYNRWKINSMDLSAYIGQNITIDIIVTDCTASGHYGKIYFDAQCGPMVVKGNGIDFDAGVTNVIVPTCGAAGATICAPSGLGPYYWAGPGILPNQATPSMTNQCLTSTISATYTLYMQPAGSCAPITRVVTSTITPAPLLIASTQQASCGQTLAIVTLTPSGSAAVPSTINWSPNPQSLSTNTQVGTYVIPGTGTTVVSITATDPLGCLVTATANVNSAPPFPTFTIQNITNSYSITCLTPTIQLDAITNYNYDNGVLNYFWSSNSNTLTGNTTIIDASTAGTYTVYAVDPATNCGATQTVAISVNVSAPTSTVNPALSVINCNQTSLPTVTLTAPTSVNMTHFVTSPLGGTYTATGGSANYPTGVPGTYTYVLVNDVNGCAVTKQFTVSANQGFPTFNLTSPQSYTLGCGATSVAIININNASATNSLQVPTGGAVSYTLLAPGASTATPTGSLGTSSSYSVNAPGTWTVIVKDNISFCETRVPVSILSNTASPDISAIVPTPTLSCATPTVKIKGQSLTPNVEFSFKYLTLTQPGDTITSVITTSATTPGSIAMVYTLNIKDNSSTCLSTSVITIYQNIYKPKVVITNGGVSGISCKTNSVTLTNQSTTGIPATSTFPTNNPVIGSRWDGPTPMEPKLLSTTYVGLVPGAYTLTTTDLNNGCSATSTILINDDRDFPAIGLENKYVLDCGAASAIITPSYNFDPTKQTYNWWTEGGNPASVGSATSSTFKPTEPGLYLVEVTYTVNGCSSTASVTVVNGSLSVKFEADKYQGFAPMLVNFDNQSKTTLDSVGITLVKSIWNFGNGTTSSFTSAVDASTTYSLPGTYTVTLYANKGTCVESYQKVIVVDVPSKVEVPNIFTPNGDGTNDIFFLNAAGLSEINMVILDRWGHVVYELVSASGNIEWNGKNQRGVECAAGVYFYTLKATGTDGNKYDKNGTITLTR